MTSETITRDTSVREAIALLPGAEAIFDQHGLGGCGGPNGPQEPIGFFAAIHHVDADALVAALNDYAQEQSPDAAETVEPTHEAGHPYRAFLATALALTLGGGITSGIAAAMTGGGWGNLRGESWLALVQTHGHLQLFGFVALFIAGVALHVLPRFKQMQPLPPHLVYGVFALLGGGVLLRALAQPHAQGWMRGPFVASAFIELAGVLLFAALVVRVLGVRREREPLDYYVTGAAVALVAAMAMNVYLALEAAGDRSRVVNALGEEALLVATTQGFVLLFILGIATRVLPFFMSLRQPRTGLLSMAALVLAIAIPVRVLAIWAPELTSFDAVAYERGATFAIGGAILAAVVALRVFEEPLTREPAPMAPPAFGTAIRVAFAWLVGAVLLDAYWQLREIEGGATPMYAAGAIRHAYLLGFATMMIMAMGYRTVPVFSGRLLPWRSAVPASFAMVGAAAVLRTVPVAFTTAPTDLDYKLMVAGGVLLFGGLGVFSVQVCASMFGWRPPELFTRKAPLADDPATAAPVLNGSANGSAPATPIRRDGPVTADMTIAAALAAHPIVLELLLKRGFGPLATPETRDAMAPITTIERAAPFVGSSSEDLVAYINDGIANAAAEAGEVAPAAPGIALTMIETPVTKQDVMQALESCYDPEVPVNIVDLGLVYDVLVRDDYARVTMSMTSPGCPAADMLEADVRKALRAVEGIATVDVEVVDEPAWTAERISPAGRVRLGMG